MNRAEAIEGLGNGRWEVRRNCVAYLYRHGDADDLPALLPLLHDPRSKVRVIATHAIGSDAERAAAASIDAIPLLIERALEDESTRVRRHAVLILAIRHAHPDLEGFFRRLLDTESDPKLHRNAGIGLAFCLQKAGRPLLAGGGAPC